MTGIPDQPYVAPLGRDPKPGTSMDEPRIYRLSDLRPLRDFSRWRYEVAEERHGIAPKVFWQVFFTNRANAVAFFSRCQAFGAEAGARWLQGLTRGKHYKFPTAQGDQG